MTALTLLCEIIALGGNAAAALYRDDPRFAVLLRHGYLREAGVLTSVVCNDCDDAHAAPIVFEDGRYGYQCPELGFVVLDRADVQAVRPDPLFLIDCLFEVMGCKRRKQTPVHGQTWRIGSVETDAGEIMLYFHPNLESEDNARDVAHSLSREVRVQWRLIVTAIGTLAVGEAQTVKLIDFAAIDAETGAFRILTPPADLVGIPRKNKGGRPSEQGPALAEIISDRQKSGAALLGLNAESKAILAVFKERHPDKHFPSFETVRRHLKKSQGGS
ncbi:MAG: hypothetical protein KDK08_29260 [Rhizobiaceae bacterium]|nr:hypothetical protein [Rhizobiaceae bacterium]